MIWVIGGTSGIGKEVVKQLETRGNVVLSTGIECDVRDPISLQRQVDWIAGSCHPLDGVVYSAGINALQYLGSMDVSGLQTAKCVVDTNLLGFINVIDCLCNGRGKSKPLSVVAVSSDAATRPMRTSVAYCASKAGLDMAVRCAARELAPLYWRVNAVSPGMTEGTSMTSYIDNTVPDLRGWSYRETMEYEKSQEVTPGRVKKSEVAKVIISTLFGPPHLNGAIIPINGGR